MPTDKEDIKQAILEAHSEIRYDRGQRTAIGEGLQIIISITAITGFLAWFVPKLLIGTLGLILAGGNLAFAIGTVIMMHRRGRSYTAAILITALVGALGFAATYGVMWYFMGYLLNSGQPLFSFPMK